MNGMAYFFAAISLVLTILLPLSQIQSKQIGYDEGLAAGRAECQQQTIEELQVLISSTEGLTEQAHAASTALNRSISARQQADANTTKELTDALALTAAERAQCRFDDDSMRHTAAARDRAAQAAAGGLGGAVPAAGGDE
ncbi:FliH/SctL family protein [Pseudomonas abyssi]|uniref:hypothetical protein n=1 Tax=Pseudomonas abyssi TaxID=170540 RepID=UPI000E4D0201|nr:hypothetical protein [Halopseudomonas gallaeciensis]